MLSFHIRSFTPRDAEACKRLYLEGPIGRENASNDTGIDIDDIDLAYMRSPGSHFWVAENDRGEVVGMIGVQAHEVGEGEIRRLRVRCDHRGRGIGTALLEQAIQFCKLHEYLKVTLDTSFDLEPTIKLFEKHQFKHTRTKDLGGKTLIYFYFDLYWGHPRRHDKK